MPEFFAEYSQLNRSLHGLADAPEWPAIRTLIPNVHGKQIVDLGCGFGWFARWAGEQGAAYVLGLDLPENMLARARTLTEGEQIEYAIADLERIVLPEASFDIAYSSLAFHHIEDFAKLMAAVHTALVPGGRLIFSDEHPIYMDPSHPGWSVDSEGQRVWPVNQYRVEGPRMTDWLAGGRGETPPDHEDHPEHVDRGPALKSGMWRSGARLPSSLPQCLIWPMRLSDQ